jgi:AmpE protein
MNFLVVLVCLGINYLWLKDVDRFDDGWFFKFRCKVENRTQAEGEVSNSWLFNLLIIYLFPLSVLIAALLVIDGVAFGALTMILHGIVLLVAFDRKQPGKLAREFIAQWKENGMEAAKGYLEHEFNSCELAEVNNEKDLASFFSKQLIHRSFERMFVMFFWYVLAGPVLVAFSYISYQLSDSHAEKQAAETVNTVDVFISVLEWIPLRLLALTFSLAGNFEQCFESLKRTFWEFSLASNNGQLLYDYSQGALKGIAAEIVEENDLTQECQSPIDKEAFRIRALQALLERSQAIWLVILGLITIFGL